MKTKKFFFKWTKFFVKITSIACTTDLLQMALLLFFFKESSIIDRVNKEHIFRDLKCLYIPLELCYNYICIQLVIPNLQPGKTIEFYLINLR